MGIRSPLTNSNNIILEKQISCSFIIKKYKEELDINVSKYFKHLDNIQIYKCLDTGLKFYYPFNIDGDKEFYKRLQMYPWYYMDWKWEHEVVSVISEPKDQILEIGCAKGGFLKKMQQNGNQCVGLELNENAAKIGRKKGVHILNQSIEKHAKENPEKYNIVCSFQVVEHITSTKEFIQSSIDALKPGGQFVISVPNHYTDSPLKNSILDMPPHHMNIWNSVSLANLQNIFPIRLEQLEVEPLQAYHLNCYAANMQKNIGQYNLPGKIINKINRLLIKKILREASGYIMGHTILAQYKKINI